MNRPYDELKAGLAGLAGDRLARMGAVVDALWDALHPTRVSWVGFYLREGDEHLVLGPRRDRPACSPIAIHGVCGQALTRRRPIVVHDVTELGKNYIACDPRDRSEVVVPLFDDSGTCWGVLDLDSHDVGAFDGGDVDGLHRILEAAGLTRAGDPTTDQHDSAALPAEPGGPVRGLPDPRSGSARCP